ncbi:MAG: hypothetical protein JWO44_678 [Bacteroidetes bacterium]|nr:hypothetical protein [Bacteroidota bacterium]
MQGEGIETEVAGIDISPLGNAMEAEGIETEVAGIDISPMGNAMEAKELMRQVREMIRKPWKQEG